MATPENSAAPIVIYQAADGSIATEVRLEATIRNFRIARQEGQRKIERTLRSPPFKKGELGGIYVHRLAHSMNYEKINKMEIVNSARKEYVAQT